MKKSLLVLLLLALSVLSGYLMSKATLVSRVGITFFYKEYNFLKVWWQGALAVFVILLIFILLQGYIQNKYAKQTARMVHLVAIPVALFGLFLTYSDFRHTLSHRLLGERFHLGAYLFWIGWIMISLFYVLQKEVVDTKGIATEQSQQTIQ